MDGLHTAVVGRIVNQSSRRGLGGGMASFRTRLPFLLAVVMPTLLAAAYYFVWASPQYVSEASFVVRGQSSAPTGMLSSLLLSGASGTASEDTYAVQDYMMSRDAAASLIQSDNLRAVFNPKGADPLSRFPGWFGGKTFEHFYAYYQRHVTAELDTTTGISTLKVRTYSAASSNRIARALLVNAEQLINRMNARQRANLVSSAAEEVSAGENTLREIAAQLADYRNREALLDPMKQSVPMLRNISDLQAMLSTTRIQLAQLRASAPSSPLIPVYERRAIALQSQIAGSNATITGSSTSLVPKITTYDDLMLQQTFGEKQLANAITALDTAKAQANRQQLFLDEIIQPDSPDYAVYPRGVISTAVVFVTLFCLYLMARLVINGAREHQIV